MTRQSIKQVEVPLDLEPFRIDNPSKLGDWEAREILTMTASEPNVSKSVNFSLNSERWKPAAQSPTVRPKVPSALWI